MHAVKQIGLRKAVRYGVMSVLHALYRMLLVSPLRVLFLRMAGASIGAAAVIHDVRFYNLYRTGIRGLEIGRRCFLGDEVLIDLADRVVLEDDVTVAARVHVITHLNVGYPAHPLQPHFPSLQSPVRIKRGAFIGANAVILSGVTIGERAFVGASALVCDDVPADAVVAGVPARVIRRLPPAATEK